MVGSVACIHRLVPNRGTMVGKSEVKLSSTKVLSIISIEAPLIWVYGFEPMKQSDACSTKDTRYSTEILQDL